MTNIIEESFKINIPLMKSLGLYSTDRHPLVSQIYGIILFIICVICTGISGYINWIEKPTVMLANVSPCVPIEDTFLSIKLLPLLINRQRVKRCVNFLAHPFFAPKGLQQKKIVADCVRHCQLLNLVYFVGLLGLMGLGLVVPFFLPGQRFPVDFWFPYEATASARRFSLTYILIVFVVGYISFAGTMTDPLLGGLTFHITSQLRVIKYDLLHLSDYKYNATYKLVKRCARHHAIILRYAKEYEECFSLVIFSQLGCTITIAGMLIFEVITSSLYSQTAITCALAACAVLFQFFFFCYYGQLLFEENSGLIDAIYLGKWYNCNIPTQKALITMMERSKIPLILTAGKVARLTLETFGKMLKTIYSVVALLKKYY